MINLIDNLFPWFGDMVELGGNILLAIIFMAVIIGSLVLERLGYLHLIYPAQRDRAVVLWHTRDPLGNWYALHLRQLLITRLRRSLSRNINLTKTLIKLCPLLGLLGTVLGMLEVFDAVAATGANNPRSTASGVSKATVTTMAGMVVAIASMLATNFVSKRLTAEGNKLNDLMDIEPDFMKPEGSNNAQNAEQ